MKSFRERFDLTDLKIIDGMFQRVESTHRAIQAVEAGVQYSKRDMALATFRFLDILGYYPETVKIGVNRYTVQSVRLMQDGDKFTVDFKVKGRLGVYTTGLFGPLENDERIVKLDDRALETVIDRAFPKAQINGGEDATIEDKPQLFHLTIREKYMQSGKSLRPVASGSATCSDMRIALMQATTRMVHTILVRAKLDYLEKKNALGETLKAGATKYNCFVSSRDPGIVGQPAKEYRDQYRAKYGHMPQKFGGYDIKHIWFDELVKPADDASDEYWLKWPAKSPDPKVPPVKPVEKSFEELFKEAIDKTREDFYRTEGKTPKNILAWLQVEGYLRAMLKSKS